MELGSLESAEVIGQITTRITDPKRSLDFYQRRRLCCARWCSWIAMLVRVMGMKLMSVQAQMRCSHRLSASSKTTCCAAGGDSLPLHAPCLQCYSTVNQRSTS